MKNETIAELVSGVVAIVCLVTSILSMAYGNAALLAGVLLAFSVFAWLCTFQFEHDRIEYLVLRDRMWSAERIAEQRGEAVAGLSKELQQAQKERAQTIEPGDEVLVKRGSGETYRGVCLDNRNAYIPSTGKVEQGTLWKIDIIEQADIMFEFNKDTLTANIEQALEKKENA